MQKQSLEILYVTSRLMQVNPTLARQARTVLDVNKSERHIRGGLATREKYANSTSQRSVGKEVSYAEAEPGDIICYPGHVAIYIGNGKIVHASSAKTGIKISNLGRLYPNALYTDCVKPEQSAPFVRLVPPAT